MVDVSTATRAPAQTAGAEAAAPSEGLAEVIVTARRRAENLQDVPIAVTAAAYTWPLSQGALQARVGWDWRSFTKVANTTASVTDQPAYGLVDAGVAFTTSGGAWRFALDGKNLLDRWYRVSGYDFGTGLLGNVSVIGFYGAPRTYSFTAQYHY